MGKCNQHVPGDYKCRQRRMIITQEFKSGFVALVGRPNVGKSTLLNCLMGEKLAIVTNKPQTTRNKIRGILTSPDSQIVFLDTPGIHRPKSKLGQNMVKMAQNATDDGDIIILITAPGKNAAAQDAPIIADIARRRAAKFLVINKIDTIPKADILPITETYADMGIFDEIIPLSALNGENVAALRQTIMTRIPPGPAYFPADMTTDMPDKFLISEVIREKALLALQEETPHGIAIEIEKFARREDKEIIDIEAVMYCEKDSHKGMVIGKKGAMLKQIGTAARQDIARMYDERINLQIWVKIKENWRDRDFYIKNFGYRPD